MPVRKCSACGAEWTSSLQRCPLCGGEATEREGPTGKIVLKSAAVARKKEEESAVDLAAEIRKELSDLPPMEVPPTPEPEPPKPEPPRVEQQAEAPPPIAPAVPETGARRGVSSPVAPAVPETGARRGTNTLPLVLAILSFLGCAILPLTLFYDHAKILGIAVPKFGYAAAGVLALLAPFAWLRARTGPTRLLGMLATFGYVASFATVMILEAIARWTR